MLQEFAVITRVVLLVLVAAFGPHVPESSLQVMILVLVGAIALTPLVPRVIDRLRRALVLPPHTPPVRRRSISDFTHPVPEEPGTRGTVRSRAPSFVVRAVA